MATLKLPCANSLPWYNFTLSLSGARYIFEMQFNTRSDRYYLSLYDAGGQVIVLGVPLLTGRALLDQYRTRPVPPGSLFVVDTTGQEQPPTLGSFATTHALLYVEP